MGAEDHYPSLDQLSTLHKEKIEELRSRISDELQLYPDYDTEFSMLRWLMGWDYDIETIVPKAKRAIIALKALHLDEVHVETAEDVNAHVVSLNNVAPYFPGGLMSQDNDGNVVYMQALARTHPKSLARADCVSELFKLSIIETELAFKLVRAAEKRSGRKMGVKIIIDLEGFNMDLLYTPTLKIYMSLLSMMQVIFPDFARKIYVINPPMMMSTVFTLIKPTLSKQTAEKVVILNGNYQETIINDIGSSNVLPHWGGTKKAECSTGSVRMGGKVLEKLWYKAANNPHDVESTFMKLSVPARSKNEVKMLVKKGQTVRWLFRVSCGDIEFSVNDHKGMKVWPAFRLITEFVPEYNSFVAREDAEYTFTFDNSHGKFWSKDIKYKVFTE